MIVIIMVYDVVCTMINKRGREEKYQTKKKCFMNGMFYGEGYY